MAGYIKGVKAEKVEVAALNTKINKKVFDDFKVRCLELRYPMNVMLEIFMQQYVDGKFNINTREILKWETDKGEVSTLNTTFNKEIYSNFKTICKNNGFYVKHVIAAFMEEFVNKKFILEYVEITEKKDNWGW